MNSQDLQQIDKLLSKRLDEKLKNLATKDDIKESEAKVIEDISNVINAYADALNERKAEKIEVAAHGIRLDELERKVLLQP